jgi:CheY-like chemotaxis protein
MIRDHRRILMLEDDRERLDRFAKVLASRLRSAQFDYWRSAPEFITAYEQLEQYPHLIALDHDLFVDHPDDPDPGDGRDVARFLANRPPSCPVLIHSTNGPAADNMLFTLRDAGWRVERIAPIGDDWIEADWRLVMQGLIEQFPD